MRVLLCGYRSFAAQGLADTLRRAGHEVVCFGRGPAARAGDVVTGPADAIADNPHLRDPFDAVVNYVLMKDDTLERNNAYLASLLRLCAARSVSHLVHVSSVSSYRASERVVREAAEIEQVPQRKGAYGSLKVGTDLYLLAHAPPGLKLSLVRPGFILGRGLVNPIVGTAARLPWNRLLVVGTGRSVIPMTTRELVNEAVARCVAAPPAGPREVLLLVAPDSPTRTEFLEACCRDLGVSAGVARLPVPLWYGLAVGAEAAARVLGQGKLRPYQKLTARLTRQRFDASETARRLGMDLRVDWRAGLRASLDGQAANYQLPYAPADLSAGGAARPAGGRVTFLGFGRIVRQKHLPALKAIGFAGEVLAYDLADAPAGPEGVAVRAVAGARPEPADLFVVASPGPAHAAAIGLLAEARGPVLVEKPLCYRAEELDQWLAFAAGRASPVYACHNYRYKANVARMLAHLARFNPGRLRHVAVHFESPPVAQDSAAWLRDERNARTLLMDYSLHFLDLACMFARGGWDVDAVRHERNALGQTDLIEGHLTAADYPVSFLLRQGFGPRRARLLFNFQNYSLGLGFFPDTFAAYMADDNPWLYRREARESFRATARKVADKLRGRDSDRSHAAVLRAVLAGGDQGAAAAAAAAAAGLTVGRLEAFYRLLFRLERAVYGGGGEGGSGGGPVTEASGPHAGAARAAPAGRAGA